MTPQITDEERDAMLRRIVAVTAEIRKIAEAVAPAVVAAAAELQKAFSALQEAGLLDEPPVTPQLAAGHPDPFDPASRDRPGVPFSITLRSLPRPWP
jgi:uncharacterized protein (DUF1501 family)